MLLQLAGVMDPELWFAKRSISFINMWLKSDNNIVKTISMLRVSGLHFVLGVNYRVLCTKYGMNLNNMLNGKKDVQFRKKLLKKCERGV